MKALRQITGLTIASVLAGVILLGGFGTTEEASGAAACHHVSLGVSKRTVRKGGTVRVHGSTCRKSHPHWVRVRLRGPHGWRRVGVVHTRANGRFAKRVRIRVGRRSVTRVQAKAAHSISNTVPLTIKSARSASGPGGNCPLRDPGSEIGLTTRGCRVLFDDTANVKDAARLWGRIDCGIYPNPIPSRTTVVAGGGDNHLTATGASQGNDEFRRMTVFDGDDIAGERCELGENDNVEGPTALFREGDRRATYASLRLPDNFSLDAQTWQTVLQMKQAQPSANGGGVPILEMQAFENRFWISSDKGIYFSFPAAKNVWTRFVFDITYSRHASEGSVQVSVDLNDDGDVNDPGERSPRVSGATLRTETAGGGPDTIAPGQSIPSHLRVGIYHNQSISCPAGTGCSTEFDNVQVLAP